MRLVSSAWTVPVESGPRENSMREPRGARMRTTTWNGAPTVTVSGATRTPSMTVESTDWTSASNASAASIRHARHGDADATASPATEEREQRLDDAGIRADRHLVDRQSPQQLSPRVP